MTRPQPEPRHRRAPLTLLAASWALSAAAYAAPGITAGTVFATPQDAAGPPDKVMRVSARSGKSSTITGEVIENSLTSVVVKQKGKESTYKSTEVVSIDWGQTPSSYRDGKTFMSRGDYENAVTRFRMAATNTDARDVVKASARLHAVEALLSWGAKDANKYADCVQEVDQYLADNPDDRGVPRARWIKARAALLAGDAGAAAAGFKALFEAGFANASPGYDPTLCLEAGLAGAYASVESSNTGAARELFTALDVAFGQAASAIEDPISERKVRLLAGKAEASVGEGYCLLVSGDAKAAVRFFESRLSEAQVTAARFSASLGLAEAYLATSELRKAQVEFAKVSALDHTSRDRVARALLGLAEVTTRLNDTNAKANARSWLSKVQTLYGDTPAAAKATESLKNL